LILNERTFGIRVCIVAFFVSWTTSQAGGEGNGAVSGYIRRSIMMRYIVSPGSSENLDGGSRTYCFSTGEADWGTRVVEKVGHLMDNGVRTGE